MARATGHWDTTAEYKFKLKLVILPELIEFGPPETGLAATYVNIGIKSQPGLQIETMSQMLTRSRTARNIHEPMIIEGFTGLMLALVHGVCKARIVRSCGNSYVITGQPIIHFPTASPIERVYIISTVRRVPASVCHSIHRLIS